jgi:hypothetical protein
MNARVPTVARTQAEARTAMRRARRIFEMTHRNILAPSSADRGAEQEALPASSTHGVGELAFGDPRGETAWLTRGIRSRRSLQIIACC